MFKKGIIYIMTTAIEGLIKIGVAKDKKSFNERIRGLRKNGYANVTNLELFFAIRIKNYEEKEKLLARLFSKSKVGSTEIYALDADDVQRLFLSFEGQIIYPEKENQDKLFTKITRSQNLTFYKIGLKDGDVIEFIKDPNYKAKIVSKNEVEYKGVLYKLSALTRHIYNELGKGNKSDTYAGFDHFSYKGTKLRKLYKK